MTDKTAFEEYLFGGGLEATAREGVAQAVAATKAAGLTPATAETVRAKSEMDTTRGVKVSAPE